MLLCEIFSLKEIRVGIATLLYLRHEAVFIACRIQSKTESEQKFPVFDES